MKKLYRRIMRFFNRLPEWLRLSIVGVIALCFFFFGGIIAWAALMPIPAINNFENREIAESTKIYDRTGNVVLYDVHGAVRRTSVPLDAISPYIKEATIAIEDASFYTNWGFRPLAFMRAILADITTGSYGQGGSTITQQVVKNALLTKKKTLTRKLQEIILALRLDSIYSKDEILETYLNENPYGGTIYGVQEASQYFFGVDAKDVDLAQAAYLAALPQAPTYYSPYGNHRDALDARQNLVLQRMLTLGYITQEEYDRAKAEQVQFSSAAEVGIKAPHFVFYIREYLESKYGVDAVDREGLRVYTTLDYDLQQKAEAIVAKWAPQMKTNFNANNQGMVAVEPSSGQILAMVGSNDFSNTQYGQVNVTLALRQPGSSFKPFVYATALKEGYTPDTVVFDLPTQFSTACSPADNLNSEPPCYSPGNYDGTFKGPITMRNALAISENIPAVKFLYLAGIDNAIATAQDLGITTLATAARYGLTLVLGGGEVSLLEMTGAYAVFANDGIKNPPTGILRVVDRDGNILEEYQNQATRVLEPQVARQINDMLSDNEARTPEFGADSPLYFPGYDVADKTGTTNDFRDVWIIGYTPGISVGAWAGNNDNTPMARRIAAFIIAPMWHEFVEYALEKYPAATDFVPPAPETDSLPPVLRGEWNTNPAQGVHDILYWTKKGNPRGGAPTNPYSDPQAVAWDYPVALWAAGQGMGSTPVPGTTGGTSSGFAITSPIPNSYVQPNLPLPIAVNYPDPSQVTSIEYFLNGSSIGTAIAAPYTITHTPTSRGQAVLQAVAHLTNGQTQTAQINFTIQ